MVEGVEVARLRADVAARDRELAGVRAEWELQAHALREARAVAAALRVERAELWALRDQVLSWNEELERENTRVRIAGYRFLALCRMPGVDESGELAASIRQALALSSKPSVATEGVNHAEV
ncbi:hypothetical protein [Pseudonocardia spinosispora]|uniref:hypothetical protein n=1 Tax=Pseudonocardia spinosispora TaxID=103441 RepID=UPI0004125CE9|nr:hypothetical protein [Pseudonocardia spinosispora]